MDQAESSAEHTRDRLQIAKERLRCARRAVLRPEVLQHLLPARAESVRRRGPDEQARARETIHLAASIAYRSAVAAGAPPPPGADAVTIGGVEWTIPADRREPGRLADRMLHSELPLGDILRTREAIGGGVMLDIGGNVGTTSILRAILGDFTTIAAAEPDADNFACLVRNVVRAGLAGIILPDRVAIGDRDGSIQMKRSRSIGGHRVTGFSDDPDAGIPMTTLEQWVRALQIEVDALRFVKIDTQGYEAHVLAGAGSLLSLPGVVWELEFAPSLLTACGRGPGELIDRLASAFSYFVDLFPGAPGPRVRPVAELREALAYVDRSYTDLLVYRA